MSAVHVHGHVLAVPATNSVIAVIDAAPGVASETKRFTVSGATLTSGQDFNATLDTATSTLTNVQPLVALATMPPARLVTNGSAKSIALDTVVFILGVLILGGALAWITKRVLIDEKH